MRQAVSAQRWTAEGMPGVQGREEAQAAENAWCGRESAAELGASYGRYVAMSMEERSKLKEEKTMAEQQKTTEMGTIKTQTTENQVQQVQNQVQPERDALQEYISYLEQQSVELTARIERIRIALEEAAAYSSVRHSEWRQHKENPRTGGNQ